MTDITVEITTNTMNTIIRQKITKTLPELIKEVSENKYADFHDYLRENEITHLDLSKDLVLNCDLFHLGLALNHTNIKSINLSLNSIDPEKAKAFGLALSGNTTLTTVNLKGNNLGDIGARDFALTLKNTVITHIMLNYNDIGPIGAKDLALALKESKVTMLTLGGNTIGNIGAKDLIQGLKNTLVNHLELWQCGIGPDGAKAMGPALKDTGITDLDLTWNTIGNLGAKHLGLGLKNSQIKSIDLTRNHIGSKGAQDFAETLEDTSLIAIGLGRNNIEKDGILSFIKIIPKTQLIFIDLKTNTANQQLAALNEIAGGDAPQNDMKENKYTQQLTKALQLNKKRLILSPYVLASLKLLPPSEKQKYWEKTGLEKKEENFINGCGILMHENMPDDIRGHILGFLPLMQTRKGNNQAFGYLQILKTTYKNKTIEINTPREEAPEETPTQNWCTQQ